MRNHDIVLRVSAAAMLSCAGWGCRLMRSAAEVPAQAIRTVAPAPKAEPAVDAVDVQQTLLKFADEFSARAALGIDALRRGTNALGQAERLHWQLAFGSACLSTVSGPNALANLLDMTVFVTEARLSLEAHWLPKVFGDSAQPLLEDCRAAELEIWRYAGGVLKPAEQTALREAVEQWHRQKAQPETILVARAAGIALQVAKAQQPGSSQPATLLGLLKLDPLAGLDPARRELAQTRLFAERALFVLQKQPTLLRWQAELLAVNALEQPAAQHWADTARQLADSADRFARAAERLPGQLSAEREAILQSLEAQEQTLKPLLGEARQTLSEGTRLAAALETTLTTFDGVLERLGVGEHAPDCAPTTNAAPFRIQDYAETAARLEAAARQLTELLQTFDQTLGANSRSQLAAQLAPVVQQAQDGGKGLADFIFWRGVLFVAIVLLAALAHRALAARLGGAPRERKQP